MVSSNKKGTIAWEYVAAIILGLLVLVLLIAFSTTLKEKILDGIRYFIEKILGR